MNEDPVLVVDDDPYILEAVALLLELEGYAVETAGDGIEALRMLDRVHPSVVLLDMQMPRLDGLGFAQALGRRAEKPKVLVMTAARDARRWAEEICADGYLPKPFQIDDLLNAVERLRKARGDEARGDRREAGGDARNWSS
jgi:two-component system, OmpR family, response regulator MprA